MIETEQRGRVPLWPWLPANCVGLVRGILAVGVPWIVTPYQLYRHLSGRGMQLLPGKSLFSPPKPKFPKIERPVVAERTDPDVTAARDEARMAELRRRGRASTILTGGRGDTSEAPLGRPAAGGSNASQTLG